MRTLLVHNPSAGKGDHPKEELLAILRLAGYEVVYCSTHGSDFPEPLREPWDFIVIAGGDGTVRKVMTNLPDRATPLAILPLGTANNIARSLGISGERQNIVNGWQNGRTCRFDIGIISGPLEPRLFVEGVGIGALASITDDKVGGKLEGKERILFGREAFRTALDEAEPLDIELEIDGRPYAGNWLAIEIMNNSYTGPRLPLCPAADSGDGLFDIAAIGEKQRGEMLHWLADPEKSEPPIRTERGRSIRIAFRGRPPFRVDDKVYDVPKGKKTAALISLHDRPFDIILSRNDEAREQPGETSRRLPLEDA